uniref:Uncharacterized protein n=1 Tax=Triticum monococcum TaxID=4568 RepID=Q6RUK7_TRIMO|nr:putative protein [Triticum monococcum]
MGAQPRSPALHPDPPARVKTYIPGGFGGGGALRAVTLLEASSRYPLSSDPLYLHRERTNVACSKFAYLLGPGSSVSEDFRSVSGASLACPPSATQPAKPSGTASARDGWHGPLRTRSRRREQQLALGAATPSCTPAPAPGSSLSLPEGGVAEHAPYPGDEPQCIDRSGLLALAEEEQWYILYAVPDVSEDLMKPQKFPNTVFTFNEVPLPSRLFVESSVASPAGIVEYPYIAATDRSSHLLLCGYTSIGLTLYICDPFFRRTTGIFPHGGGFTCRHCVGLIRDHGRRLLMVADLITCFFEEVAFFTLFCTVDLYSWVEKELDCSKILDKQPWRGDGVLILEGGSR